MQVWNKTIRYFTIYDLKDNYVFECKGYKELANYLGRTIKSAYSTFSRIRSGRTKEVISKRDNKKYKIYVYIEKEVEDD